MLLTFSISINIPLDNMAMSIIIILRLVDWFRQGYKELLLYFKIIIYFMIDTGVQVEGSDPNLTNPKPKPNP